MTTPPQPPAPAPPPAPPADPPAPPASDAKFSQADVDRIVTERLSRERGKFADYDDLKAKAGQFDELQQANATELEKAVAKARAEGSAEARQAAYADVLAARIQAEAAGKLANPEIAPRLLDLSAFKDDGTGRPDGQAIAAAIEQLVKDMPNLAPAAPPQQRFQGTGDGGTRGNGAGPQQVTETEFKAMSHADRVKARKEGRLADLLAGKAT